jgi:PAS domain S-box-containing protein
MKISLGALLAICLAGLQFLAVLTVVLLSYITSERVLLDHARTLLSDLGRNTILHSQSFLDPARSTAELAKRLAENNIVASDNHQALEKLLFQQLQLAPQFAGVYLGDEDGNFVYVSRVDGPAQYRTKIVSYTDGVRKTELMWRDTDYTIVDSMIDRQDIFDPRTRPWYERAKTRGDIIWTDPYIFFSSQRPGITAASPVIGNNDEIRGVVGVDIEIQEISDFLSQLKIGTKGAAMILNRNGDVIAHPESDLIKMENADGRLDFVSIDEINDQIAKTAFGDLTKLEVVNIDSEIQSEFTHEGDTYVSALIPAKSNEIPWTIAIYAPEDDFIGGIKENRKLNVWIAAIIAMISGILGLKLAQFIHQPFRDFASGAQLVSQGEVHSAPLLANRYPELQAANETLIEQVEQRKNFEREFGQTFDLASRGMAQLHPETGRFIRVNQHLTDILGYTSAQMLELTLTDILHPDERETNVLIHDTVNSDYEYKQESRFIRKDTQTVWLRINAIMIRDENGVAHHAVATLDDVTDQKEADTKIHELNRDLSHFSRVGMMGQMASGLAHELNQPLTAITQNADAALSTLLARKKADPELVEILNELDAQAHRGADIIRALRGFVTKDSGEKQAFDLAELVDQAFKLVKPEVRANKITMSFVPTPLPLVYGNRIQVAQVLVNLLRNAIQAIDTANTDIRLVEVIAHIKEPFVELWVEDTGSGVSPEIDLFTQFETSKPDGMGLGLSFSRDIIEAGGGELWFDDNAAGKSRFCFSIPSYKEGNDD